MTLSTIKAAYDGLNQLASQMFPLLKQYPFERHRTGQQLAKQVGVPNSTRQVQSNSLFNTASQHNNSVAPVQDSTYAVSGLPLHGVPMQGLSPYTPKSAHG